MTAAQDRYACLVCSYSYDPARGDPTQRVPPGVLFEALPKRWHCPWCGAGKEQFRPEEQMLEELREGML